MMVTLFGGGGVGSGVGSTRGGGSVRTGSGVGVGIGVGAGAAVTTGAGVFTATSGAGLLVFALDLAGLDRQALFGVGTGVASGRGFTRIGVGVGVGLGVATAGVCAVSFVVPAFLATTKARVPARTAPPANARMGFIDSSCGRPSFESAALIV
jgi:hypothetical protein